MTWLQALVALALSVPGVIAPRAHIEVWQLSMFSCAVFAVGIPASFWGGGFIARMGSLRIASLCAVAVIASMALASIGSTAGLLAAGLCLGLAFGPETPASAALLARLVTTERRAFVFSVRQTGIQIGAVCGSLALPAIAIAFGPAWCYAAVAASALLAILLFEWLRPVYAGKIVPPPQFDLRARLAVVTTDPERTLADAAAIDARLRDGETMPLAGVPIVVKDNIWVGGWRVTQGSRLFADFVAPQDAIAIERLRRAGAVVVGIGATSEFASKGVTTSQLFGPTRHPQNPALTPGGSSGGPAAAVAAGLVPLGIGTDAGGSSRRPPAHVGVAGFKPSYCAIPYGPGFAEPFFGLSVIAPIAFDVGDIVLAFEAIAGDDPRDPDSANIAQDASDISSQRIAFSPRLGLDVAVDDVVANGLVSAVARLAVAGLPVAQRDSVWPPGATEDAIMPLQHAGLATLYGDGFRKDPTAFDPDIARQVERGLAWSGSDVARALLASTSIADPFATFFTEVDLLLAPTVPCVAWPFTQLGPDMIGGRPASPRGHAVFTPFVNHARLPAISIPCGRDKAGLPFGLQIIARRGQDRALLHAARHIEALLRA